MDIKTSTFATGPLPLIVEPKDVANPSTASAIEWIEGNSKWLDGKLLIHGGVLLRGFAIYESAEFQLVAQSLIPELKPYVEGQSPRTKVLDKVYTSTEYPAQFSITLHNELSYAKQPPRRIVFYCHTPSPIGGETPISDFRKVCEKMPPDLRVKFETLGVKYVKNMHANTQGLGKSWMEHFETSDRQVVEGYLNENEIDYEWTADGTLRTISIRPGIFQHPETNETHWFNQANLWHVSNFEKRRRDQLLRLCGEENLPTHAYYGDGTVITDEELDEVRKVMWDNAIAFRWERGDVLLLDNYLVAHGRNPYEGPRKILVAMG